MDVENWNLQDWYESDEFFTANERSDLKKDRQDYGPLSIQTLYFTVSMDEAALGSGDLWFDEYRPARDHFIEAAVFSSAYLFVLLNDYRNDNPRGDWGPYLRRAEQGMGLAILGGNLEIEARLVDLTYQYRGEYAKKPHFQYWRHRAHTLAAIVDDDPETARSHLEEMTALADHEAVDERDDEPLRRLYEGLIEEDEQTIEDAAADLAAIREEVFEPPPSDCLDLISLPAVAGIALARRRNLDVQVESDAIPPIVCEHDWGPREADLSELARETLADIDAHELSS